jgi:hypothetical protein
MWMRKKGLWIWTNDMEGREVKINKVNLESIYLKKHDCSLEIIDGYVWDGWVPDNVCDTDFKYRDILRSGISGWRTT